MSEQTDREAVERLAAGMGVLARDPVTAHGITEWIGKAILSLFRGQATLRALLARAEKAEAERDALKAERVAALACVPIAILQACDAPGATGISDTLSLADVVRRMTDMGRRAVSERDAARAKALEEAAQCITSRAWDSNFQPWEVAERGAAMIRALAERQP